MDPWCSCKKQEYQDFPLNNSDLQHQHDQCKCWSITKRGIFKLVLNILTHHLAVNIHMQDMFIPNSETILKNFIQRTMNNEIPDNA